MADFIPRLKRIPAFFLFLWIFTNPLFAQIHPVRYSVEDGLSSRNCHCVTQDGNGFIWIGTSNGLDRFDGYHFQHHDVGEGKGNTVYSILADGEGRLWVGTGKGVFVYDIAQATVRPFNLETEWGVGIYSKVNVIKMADGSRLFIGTDGQGFFLYDLADGSFRQFSKHASVVSSIAGYGDGRVLVGSEGGTISLHDRDGEFIQTVCSDSGTSDPRGSDITSMAVTGGELLAGMGDKGFCIIRLGETSAPVSCKPAGISGNFVVNSLSPGHSGEWILGGRYGLYGFNVEDRLFHRMGQEDSLADFTDGASVGTLFLDKDGGLWCTLVNSGLLYIPPERKGHKGLMKDWNVTAIAKDDAGGCWFGTLSGELFRSKASGKDPQRLPVNLPDIRCLMVDLPEVWIGTTSDGIFIYNTVSGRLRNCRYDRYDQTTVSDNCINAIFKDSGGKIYIGTEWGLNYFNRDKGSFRFEPRSSNRSQIAGFFEDSKENVWILTENDGAYRVSVKGKGWEHFYTGRNPMMTGNQINCAQEDGLGRIWLGSSNGLCVFSYETRRFAGILQDGSLLEGKDILSIEKDEGGHLWIATDTEIACVDTETDEILGTLDSDDGLCCEQFVQNVSSSVNGKMMLFGGIHGVDRLSAKTLSNEMSRSRDLTEVRVTGISVGGKDLNEREDIVLKHDAANIVFQFSDRTALIQEF